jgi:hypothetical protein
MSKLLGLALVSIAGVATFAGAQPNESDFPLNIRVISFSKHLPESSNSTTNCEDTSIPGYEKTVQCRTVGLEGYEKDLQLKIGNTTYIARCLHCGNSRKGIIGVGEYRGRWKMKDVELEILSADEKGKPRTAVYRVLSATAAASMLVQEAPTARSHDTANELNEIYDDESHCLRSPEISNKGNSISCYCRDSLVDIGYVYHNYVITGKDDNLVGIVLALEVYARQMCGESYDVLSPQKENWRWNGPEVTRTYLPDAEVERFTPDDKGWRTVPYAVRITYRNSAGSIERLENFTALERLPPNFKEMLKQAGRQTRAK